MYGIEVRDKEVSVVVAHLALDHGRNPLQSHSRVHMLLWQYLQISTRLSVTEGREGGREGEGGRGSKGGRERGGGREREREGGSYRKK